MRKQLLSLNSAMELRLTQSVLACKYGGAVAPAASAAVALPNEWEPGSGRQTARDESAKSLLPAPRAGANPEAIVAVLYLSENCGGETCVDGEGAIAYEIGTVLLMTIRTLYHGTAVLGAGRRLTQHIVLRAQAAEWIQDQGCCFAMCGHEALIAELSEPQRCCLGFPSKTSRYWNPHLSNQFSSTAC